MATAALDAKLICRIKNSVAIDLSIFENVIFTIKWVADGRPHIIEREIRGEYCLVLYNKECGVLDGGSSKALHALTKLATLSVESQAYVGMDTKIKNHCLVVANILAPPGLAHMVISTILPCYGYKWCNYLTISKAYAKDRHISKILWDMTMKRTHSNKSHSTSTLETARKRIKLSNSSSEGNIAGNFSHENAIIDLTSANSTLKKTVSSSSNMSKNSIMITNNEGIPTVFDDHNISKDKTDSPSKKVKYSIRITKEEDSTAVSNQNNKSRDKTNSSLKNTNTKNKERPSTSDQNKSRNRTESLIENIISEYENRLAMADKNKSRNKTDSLLKNTATTDRDLPAVSDRDNKSRNKTDSLLKNIRSPQLSSISNDHSARKKYPLRSSTITQSIDNISCNEVSHCSKSLDVTNCNNTQDINSVIKTNSRKYTKTVVPSINTDTSSSFSLAPSASASEVNKQDVEQEHTTEKLITDSKANVSIALNLKNNNADIRNTSPTITLCVDNDYQNITNFNVNNASSKIDTNSSKCRDNYIIDTDSAACSTSSQIPSFCTNVVVSPDDVKQDLPSPQGAQDCFTDSKCYTSTALDCTYNTDVSENEQLSDKNNSIVKKLQFPESSTISNSIHNLSSVINEVPGSSENQNITNCNIPGINSNTSINSSIVPENLILNSNSIHNNISPQTSCTSSNTIIVLGADDKQIKVEPESPVKLNTGTTSIVLGCTKDTVGVNKMSPNERLSYDTTINGEPTKTSDLPDSIKKRLDIINRANLIQPSNSYTDSDGLPDLMDERGCSSICDFLLRKTPASDTSHSQHNSNDISSGKDNTQKPVEDNLDGGDDDELSFPVDFLSRRNKKHLNPLDDDELPEVTGEVSRVVPDVITVPDNSEPVVVKDDFDEIFDLISEFPKNIETEPCQSIQCVMLPHQKIALNWMMLRENTNELPPFWECIQEGSDYFNLGTRRRIYEKPKSINGGILADDMGLGKTLIAIALILTNHIGGKTLAKHKNILPLDASEICDDLKVTKKKNNRVKVSSAEKKDLKKPGFLFRQMYLEKVTKKKKNTPHKVKQDEQMFSSDMDDDNVVVVDPIINSLSIIPDDSTSSCSSKFSEDDKNRKSSLIVCPMSVLSNWTDQLEQHVNPSLKLQIYLYYGPERIRDVNYLKKHDIIITTYGTLTCDYRAMNLKGKSAPLHNINWLRIVLDEGHIIRNFRSQQAVAAMALNASRRWILTGTVIQNRMTDLWSMIKFLRIDPLSDRKWWNTHVTKSLERRAGPGQICFNRIQKIVKHIAIRRLKTDEINGKPLVQLPKREVVIQWVNLSKDEREIYDTMQKDGKFIVSRYFRMNTVFKNYANILVIIMRLRQLCCHPKLCTKAIEKLDQARNIMDNLKEKIDDINQLDTELNDDTNAISDEDHQKLVAQIMMFLASGDSEECAICLEILRDPVITRCAHIYCSTCINEVIENSEPLALCPLCRAEIDQNTLLNVPLDDKSEKDKTIPIDENVDTAGEWQSSAKIDLLLESLKELQREEPDVKSLIVSQFTSFLDIVEKPLRDAGFQFVRLDGTMNQSERVRVMEEFKDTDGLSPTIMLLSLTAGGVGLNLVSASRVFLLDPAWNPAVEEQCFDRCHRLGQTKDVKIYKFVVKDTVEDRMLILQKKKRKLMQKAFGGIKQNAEQRRQAALQDISTLLGLNLQYRNIPPV